MKLATLRDKSPDGRLAIVSRDLRKAVLAEGIAPTLQAALDRWTEARPQLERVYRALCDGSASGAFEFQTANCLAPLPRGHQWLDGSAYLSHVELVRRARGAQMPPEFLTDPLMYQGNSEYFIGPRAPVVAASEDWGVDFEAEVVVFTGPTPMGASVEQARASILLFGLVNDVSFRNLIPAELAKGFGFVQGKGATAFAPVAVTADELAPWWDGGKLHRDLNVHWNDRHFGAPKCGEDMNFDFPRLIAHAAKTRPLGAGTVVGSGTISNRDARYGAACIAEVRAMEMVKDGKPSTGFMRFGDCVRIEMFDDAGATIFGAIDQVVDRAP